MKRMGLALLLAGSVAATLSGCAPAALRAQPGALVRVDTSLPAPAMAAGAVYRDPGPAALLVRTDRAAYITTLFLPGSGGLQVLEVGPVQGGETRAVALPGSLGFTQVFTVASVAPLDLRAAQGARTLDEVSRLVAERARSLPAGGYNVSTQAYNVSRFGVLRVVSSVPGAQVQVDDRVVGTAPLVLDLPEGSVNLSVSKGGYTTFSQRVNVWPDTVTEVPAQLRLITGTLLVRSDVPADVYVDRQLVGRVLPPAGRAGELALPLRPGTVGVNVVPVNPALKSQTLLLRITAQRETRVDCAVTAGAYTCRAPN